MCTRGHYAATLFRIFLGKKLSYLRIYPMDVFFFLFEYTRLFLIVERKIELVKFNDLMNLTILLVIEKFCLISKKRKIKFNRYRSQVYTYMCNCATK